MQRLRVALWNVEWAIPQSGRARAIRRHLSAFDPDMICLTESHSDMLGDDHQVEAEEDYGYALREGRRKVLLWSRWPWRSIDRVGSPSLPSGRFVSATADTPLGPVDVTGICIPWSHAHVAGGRRDRTPWQDHLTFLEGLAPLLKPEPSRPSIVLGDFNQRVPRGSQPVRVFEALCDALSPHYSLATAGVSDSRNHAAIDHLAHTRDLSATVIAELPSRDAGGLRLSDHFGLVLDIRAVG